MVEIRYSKHSDQDPTPSTCSINFSYHFPFNYKLLVYNLCEIHGNVFVAKFSALHHSVPGLLQTVDCIPTDQMNLLKELF